MVLTYILLFIFLLYFFLHWIQKPWRHWPIFLLPRKSEMFYLFFKINTATSSLSPFFLFCFQLVYKVMGCTEIFPWMCHSIFDLRSPVRPSLIPPSLILLAPSLPPNSLSFSIHVTSTTLPFLIYPSSPIDLFFSLIIPFLLSCVIHSCLCRYECRLIFHTGEKTFVVLSLDYFAK